MEFTLGGGLQKRGANVCLHTDFGDGPKDLVVSCQREATGSTLMVRSWLRLRQPAGSYAPVNAPALEDLFDFF